MKKTIGFFAALLLLVALQSCRSKEKCPAYGQIEMESSITNNA